MTVQELAATYEQMLADDLAWICENQRRLYPFLAHLSDPEIIEALKVMGRAQIEREGEAD
jgi:hypothetical protein